MTPRLFLDTMPDSWLAFELSVLRRLSFRSVANPFAGEPNLDVYLKRWGVRVSTNDPAQWAWTKAQARVENNSERLTAEDVELILDEAYVPHHRLRNPALRRWFSEPDAWWFDNVRARIAQLDNRLTRAQALSVGMEVGDYALSFDEETRELRQPLSRVFRRLWEAQPPPVNNRHENTCANREAREFLAAARAEFLFLRLPRASASSPVRHSAWAWREEWIRGGDDFWDEFEGARAGRLGTRVETRQQYLHHVEELLEAALHLPSWAIAHAEDGFLSTDELVEAIRRLRRVKTVYTKDFSELMGVRASIITA